MEAGLKQGESGTMAEITYLRVKNWEQFQHYKDRRPIWIKMHLALLDDYEFGILPDLVKGHLMLIWLLAASLNNKIPNDKKYLMNRMRISEPIDVDYLIQCGWLLPWEKESAKGKQEEWSSRYISEETRKAVFARDGGRCQGCGSTKRIEYDHKIPVSKGGNSEIDNIQLLCRSCNREKTNKHPYHLATQVLNLRSLEENRREENRRDTEEKEIGDDLKKTASEFAVLFHFHLPGTSKPLLPDLTAEFQAKLDWLHAHGRNETEHIRKCIVDPKRDKTASNTIGKMWQFWKYCGLEEGNERTTKAGRNGTPTTAPGGGRYEGLQAPTI
jgi:5-methylcytosine-specific restriction endonuclease McrA